MKARFILLASICPLAACTGPAGPGSAAGGPTPPASAAPGTLAYAQLTDAAGAVKARAVLSESSSGLRVQVAAENMRPGIYAIHLHQAGECTPPDFLTAGSHFNPDGRQHGFDNPQGPHKGDLRNLAIGADGRGSLDERVQGVTLTGGAMPLLDADGAALLIHAGADDYRTDPAGASGGRTACGVITKG